MDHGSTMDIEDEGINVSIWLGNKMAVCGSRFFVCLLEDWRVLLLVLVLLVLLGWALIVALTDDYWSSCSLFVFAIILILSVSGIDVECDYDDYYCSCSNGFAVYE